MMFVFLCQVEVVVDLSGINSVTLTCNTETEGNITWKFGSGSQEVFPDENFRLEGLNLTISNIKDRGYIREYSCWRGEEKLSSVNLLLKAEEQHVSGEIFTHKFISGITEKCVFRCLCASLQAYLSTAGPSLMTVTSAVSGIRVDTQQFASDLVTTGKAHNNIDKNHNKYPLGIVYVAVT